MLCKVVGGTKGPGKEKSWERKVQGTKVPRKSRERNFSIGTILSWEWKVLGKSRYPLFHYPHTVSKHTGDKVEMNAVIMVLKDFFHQL